MDKQSREQVAAAIRKQRQLTLERQAQNFANGISVDRDCTGVVLAALEQLAERLAEGIRNRAIRAEFELDCLTEQERQEWGDRIAAAIGVMSR